MRELDEASEMTLARSEGLVASSCKLTVWSGVFSAGTLSGQLKCSGRRAREALTQAMSSVALGIDLMSLHALVSCPL